MENNGEIKDRLIGGFIVICIAMIAVSGAFVAQNYLNLVVAAAVLVGIVFFLLLFLLHTQRVNRREINDLKYYMNKPSDIEDGLIRRIEDLSRQINSVDISVSEQSPGAVSPENSNVDVSIAGPGDDLQAVNHRADFFTDRTIVTENSNRSKTRRPYCQYRPGEKNRTAS